MRHILAFALLLLPATALSARGGNSANAGNQDLVLTGDEVLTQSGGDLRINGGDLLLYDIAQFDMISSSLTVNGGDVVFSDNSTVSFRDSSFSVNGGSLNLGGSSRVVFPNTTGTIQGGSLRVMDDASMVIAGDVTITTSGNGSVEGTDLFICQGHDCLGPDLGDDLVLFEDADGMILIRIRQRPDMLTGEWNELIDTAIEQRLTNYRKLQAGHEIYFPPIDKTAGLVIVPPSTDLNGAIAEALELLDAAPCQTRLCDDDTLPDRPLPEVPSDDQPAPSLPSDEAPSLPSDEAPSAE